MRRVLILGCGGAGKTTPAQHIAHQTNLPLIHLGTLYWRPGWQHTPSDEWRYNRHPGSAGRTDHGRQPLKLAQRFAWIRSIADADPFPAGCPPEVIE